MLALIRYEITPHRLLAIRRAGASFDDASSLRNEAFEALLADRSELVDSLESMRQSLVDALFALVPTIDHRGQRRQLLKLKRCIFNRRPVTELPAALPAALRPRVEHFCELAGRLTGLLDDRREAVMARSRVVLQARLLDDRFRLAVRFASRDLSEALDRGECEAGNDFSNLERALANYAARYVTKANPLHLFASVQVLGESRAGNEISLDTRCLLDLETQILAGEMPAEKVWLSLAPVAQHDEQFLFWWMSQEGLRVRLWPSKKGVDVVVGFFSEQRHEGRPTSTLARWREYVKTLSAAAGAEAEYAFAELRDAGLLTVYMARDLIDVSNFSGMAEDPESLVESQLAAVQRYHLSMVETRHLASVEAELQSLGLRYYVNSYHSSDSTPFAIAAESVAPDLARLKPIFEARGHNFSLNDTVMRAYLKDRARRAGGAVPFLQVLTHFLGHKRRILTDYQPERPGIVSPYAQWVRQWRNQLAALDGVLDDATLDRLSASAPAAQDGGAAKSLCFNGPYDFASGTYFVSNVFGGEGHFTARYHLTRPRDEHAFELASWDHQRQRTSSAALDVELAVPPVPHLNFVVPALVVGTGMESRYSHRYESWIEPSDIEIAIEPTADGMETVIYRHARSGRPLRFYYRGFMLSQYLPAEAQLLLLGHGDIYRNPFLRSEGRPSVEDFRHDPELRYGTVCLRRECWALSHRLLQQLPRSDDPLLFSLGLRDWLQHTLSSVEELWFYRTLGGPEASYKPQFLDLRNPLSTHAFRRSLLALPRRAAMSFTVMDPAPAGLLDGFVRELMIEV